jgi:hypothetical protein
LFSAQIAEGAALTAAEVCAAAITIAAHRQSAVKELNIREMRANLGQLGELVAADGELLIRRRGQPIARVLSMTPQRRRPGHAVVGV